MLCVCCKCGALESGNGMCLTVQGSALHCFCCAQPPPMKCIHCNVERQLAPLGAHPKCIAGELHVFVYSEVWPPFPEHMPPESEEPLSTLSDPHVSVEPTKNNDINVISSLVNALPHIELASGPDVKPRLHTKSRWYTISEVRKWSHCYRCGTVRIRKPGWLKHAQKCAQNDNYSARKFFIFLHTLSWCGRLVQDAYWEKHSHPQNGSCQICSECRRNNQPLPYQPAPPPQKNGLRCNKLRHTRLIIKRKKRRETITGNAPSYNAWATDNLRISPCF